MAEKFLSVQPESSNLHLQEHYYYSVVGITKTRERGDAVVPRCLPALPGSNHPLKHEERCQRKAGPSLRLLLHPRFFPLSPVPVPCIRPVPLLPASACPAQSSGTLVCSQGAEDTDQNSVSFRRTHCARPGEPCSPRCSCPLQPSWGQWQPPRASGRSILAAPGGAKLLPAARGGRELRTLSGTLPAECGNRRGLLQKQIQMQPTK